MTSTTIGRVARVRHIHNPHLHLLAGILAVAIDDAREGCHEARQWLRGDGRNIIDYLAPEGVDLDELHRLILQESERGAAEIVQMSFADLFTMELEVLGG